MKQVNNRINPLNFKETKEGLLEKVENTSPNSVKEINYSYLIPDELVSCNFVHNRDRYSQRINIILHNGYHVEYWSHDIYDCQVIYDKLIGNPNNWKKLLYKNRSFNFNVIHKANV
jgi:predicted RNA-binding protein with EMAP domain